MAALIAAVLLNLFAFLVLILAHYFMNVYVYIHNNYSKKFSLLKSLRECKVDFMFFFIFAVVAAAVRRLGVLEI